ncbi:MAG: divalent metal cation transporter FieF [Sphingomonas sanxanigenens]|uniref:Divalent metal cation transporter FieF n=1 Tax=Sphingomonas sanxanigenens TaxID=397260 RepID=A0A2W5A6F1_9SPHN|nr:MAG: divalent metal cation transporter FieF [Sphingomonas sanxanigenens]
MSGHAAHGDLTRRAATASVATAVFLLLLKAYAAWASGSMAMLASLADTGLDLLASLTTLYAVRVAAQPADSDHRFGHGKAEALAALFQVALITASAMGIIVSATQRLSRPPMPVEAEAGILVSVLAIIATLLLTRYQKHVIARTGSVAIGADHLHYQSDLMLNGSVILALVLDRYLKLPGADALFGIGIALWLVRGAWRSASHAIDQLMDREWPEEKRQTVIDIANSSPVLNRIHDLRTRSSGMHDFIQFHAWVNPAMTVAEAHEAVEAIEEKLHAAFPGAEVLIHVDPEGQIDNAGNAMEALRETPEK